jgi:hypothetical protein
MVITLDTRDARTLKAIEIAAGAAGWAKIRTKDGRKAYGVPASSNGNRYYIVDCQSCDCYDSATAGNVCKHQQAVRIFVALSKAVKLNQSVLVAVREDDDTVSWDKPSRPRYTAADYDRVHAEELDPMTDEQKRRIFGRR